MRFAKKYTAADLAILILFSACGHNVTVPRGTTITTVAGAADTALPRQMTISVALDADKPMQVAAENFCRRVNSLSKGGLTLTLIKSADVLSDFRSGRSNFALLDYKSASELHPFFGICGENFQYESYENFSMSCNSSSILSALSENSKANVLAAFYTGSNVFVSQASFDLITSKGKKNEPQDSGDKYVTVTNSEFADSLSEMFPVDDSAPSNVFVTAAESLDARLNVLNESQTPTFVEFSISELYFTSPDKFVKTFIAPDESIQNPISDSAQDEDGVVITRTFHSIEPAWLILAPSLYEGLPPLSRAAIDEATAYMIGDLDNAYLRFDETVFDAWETEGATLSNDFKTMRTRFLRSVAPTFAEASADEHRFRELLS